MRKALAVLVPLTILACVHVSSSVLMDRSAQPVPKEDVYVFLATDTVPQSCQRVAILHGSGSQDYTDESKMIDELREKTGELGGNAVQLQTMEDAGTGERVVSALFGTGSDRDAEALALWCPERGAGAEADTAGVERDTTGEAWVRAEAG